MEKEDKNNEIQPENKHEKTDENTVVDAQESEKKSDEVDFKTKYEEVNDKFVRLYSEFENYKRRNAKERMELIKTAGSDVMKSILPVLDDFERAIKANEKSEDLKAIKEGFNLINHKIFHLLELKGLKRMEVVGKPLDPEFHEAITQIPAPTDELKGMVVEVIENGYFLNEIVLRYAKVVVGC